jgi:hypothetical protein
MSNKGQVLAAWAGPAQIVLLGVAMSPLLANFQPPPSPLASAQQIADIYRSNVNGICAGAILMILSGSLKLPFVAAISAQLRKMEGTYAPMAYMQLVAGALSSTPYYIGSICMALAAFRPDRPPEEIMLLNDLTWVTLMLPFGNNVMQLIPVAVAILGDKSAQPAFPRWLGHLSLWLAIIFLPSALIIFFKSGPLAWNGSVPFWIGLAGHGIWTVAMTVALIKAARRQERVERGLVSHTT